MINGHNVQGWDASLVWFAASSFSPLSPSPSSQGVTRNQRSQSSFNPLHILKHSEVNLFCPSLTFELFGSPLLHSLESHLLGNLT